MTFDKLVPSLFYSKIQDSFELFIDCLGFTITYAEFESANPYYVINKDNLGLLVFEDKAAAKQHYPELRLVTKDINAVYEKIASTHPHLLHPNLKVVTLRPWGAKEFAILDKQVGIIFQEW